MAVFVKEKWHVRANVQVMCLVGVVPSGQPRALGEWSESTPQSSTAENCESESVINDI